MPTVSTVTKVKDGRHVFQFDLSDDKLVIEYRHGRKEPVRITMSKFAFKELGRILFREDKPVLATSLPTDSLPSTVDAVKETSEGLTRSGDGVESGMAQ